MTELQLQSEIARKFSELFVNKRGQLFHVSNERNNKIQAYQAKSIGIINGVSDFLYFEKEHEINCLGTILIGIEVKVPGSRHLIEHIKQQIQWGEILESNGGVYRVVTTVHQAISCTQLDFKGLDITTIKQMISSTKAKTIKFE